MGSSLSDPETNRTPRSSKSRQPMIASSYSPIIYPRLSLTHTQLEQGGEYNTKDHEMEGLSLVGKASNPTKTRLDHSSPKSKTYLTVTFIWTGAKCCKRFDLAHDSSLLLPCPRYHSHPSEEPIPDVTCRGALLLTSAPLSPG